MRLKQITHNGFRALLMVLIMSGCGGLAPTVFLHTDYDFRFIERVAVIELENLTKDQGAGLRATRFFINELLAAEAFDVVEPGEVARIMAKFSLIKAGDLSKEQIIEIGNSLQVQALLFGSISESSTARTAGGAAFTVTLSTRLVDAESGITVWSATHTEDSKGFFSSLLGTSQKSQSEVTRRCVKKTIRTLIN